MFWLLDMFWLIRYHLSHLWGHSSRETQWGFDFSFGRFLSHLLKKKGGGNLNSKQNCFIEFCHMQGKYKFLHTYVWD